MDVSVAEAAARLDVDRSRIEQLLWSGRLPGRRSGRMWLIDEGVLADWSAHPRAAGRPMAPMRAWGLLDMLDGGSADWLSPVARSQVKARLRAMGDAGAGEWRALLRARSDVLVFQVHPSALDHLRVEPKVQPAGPALASAAGADLVAVQSVDELYVRPADWPRLAKRWHAKPVPSGGNLIVRQPRDIWPFDGNEAVGAAALAADLVESAEPRAVRAGVDVLRREVRSFE
jgi:excisionase family DNA binding protein